jgi:SP family arabinose:H+ symporter-like MFS transporter
MNIRLFLYATIAAMGGFITGFNSTFTGALPSIINYYQLQGAVLGLTVSVMVIGCLIGGLIATTLTRKYGFKKIFILAGIILFVMPLFSAITSNLTVFMVTRAIFGVGYSIAMALAPVYIAEISPSDIRGKLVSFFQFSIVGGILLAFVAIYLLSGIDNDWRYMLAIPVIPAILFIILVKFIPESPRWLVLKGQRTIAIKVLTQISNSQYAIDEIEGIEKGSKAQQKGNIKDILNPGYLRIIVIGSMLTIFQQLTGIAAILTFIPVIFQKMGSSGSSAFLQMIFVGVVNFVFTAVATLYSDKWGRKPLMEWGLFLIVISLLALSGLFYFNITSPILTLIFMLLYIASFSASTGPLMWVLLSEIFPARIKTYALTISTIIYWISVGATAFVFPIILNTLGGAFAFLIFAIASIVHIWFIKKFIPETRNKSLEQIEKEMID